MIVAGEKMHSNANKLHRMAPQHNRYVYAARAASFNLGLYRPVE